LLLPTHNIPSTNVDDGDLFLVLIDVLDNLENSAQTVENKRQAATFKKRKKEHACDDGEP
jgi:hypothetical protein